MLLAEILLNANSKTSVTSYTCSKQVLIKSKNVDLHYIDSIKSPSSNTL